MLRSMTWRQDVEVFLVSVLILFLELVLIRWIGTEVRVFAYLGNLILVVCFLGVGLGCYRASELSSTTRVGVNLLLLVVLVANTFRVPILDPRLLTFVLSGFEDSLVWAQATSLSGIGVVAGLVMTGVLLYLLTFVFVPLGQSLGRLLARSPRTIRAYSINIAGSLAGVWLFNVLSWASTPPSTWLLVAAIVLALWLAVAGERNWTAVGLVAAAAACIWLGRDTEKRTIWSPYQKLVVTPLTTPSRTGPVQQGYLLDVNGTVYQLVLDLSDRFVRDHPDLFADQRVERNHYNIPFAFKPSVQRLLIVGAGTGNNAAAALRHDVAQVDCVEIDPRIYALGKEIHPERPYDSPRVRMIVDDARAYFKQAQGPYDLIWFGWLDSHTLGSSYNNLRLDHYVYTLESFREARRLLAPGGLVVVNFSAQRPWIADRLYGIMKEALGTEPLVFSEEMLTPQARHIPTVTLVGGLTPPTPALIKDAAMRDYVAANTLHLAGAIRPTTDDWPYLYLQHARIPTLHWLTSLMILAVVLLARGRMFRLRQSHFDWHFFALGVAFLLLEVQTVSRATLLFGMTWVVNAIVISAVLIMILLSNLVATHWPRLPRWLPAVGLAVTVASLAIVPLDWFNGLTGTIKLMAAGAFLTTPVFFAGLLFIRSFAASPDKAQALGSNLIGALVGGLLESLSFVTGLRALVVLVGVCYFVALFYPPKGSRVASGPSG